MLVCDMKVCKTEVSPSGVLPVRSQVQGTLMQLGKKMYIFCPSCLEEIMAFINAEVAEGIDMKPMELPGLTPFTFKNPTFIPDPNDTIIYPLGGQPYSGDNTYKISDVNPYKITVGNSSVIGTITGNGTLTIAEPQAATLDKNTVQSKLEKALNEALTSIYFTNSDMPSEK